MSVKDLGVDERIVRSAELKLRPYGIDVGSYVTSVLIAVVAAPALPPIEIPAVERPTANARKCLKAAKDIESGKVKAKGYTDMDEMMKDLLK